MVLTMDSVISTIFALCAIIDATICLGLLLKYVIILYAIFTHESDYRQIITNLRAGNVYTKEQSKEMRRAINSDILGIVFTMLGIALTGGGAWVLFRLV